MAKFRKKPVVIEAFQMTKESRESNADWPEWLHRAWNEGRGKPGSLFPVDNMATPDMGNRMLCIGTLEGPLKVSWGDWIIQGVQGEIDLCKPDIFEATYEPFEEHPIPKNILDWITETSPTITE
jgi:hypothetical protein